MSVGKRHEHPKCGHFRGYSYMHDALFCDYCDEWLEEKCTDPKCVHCRERPEKPSKRKHVTK